MCKRWSIKAKDLCLFWKTVYPRVIAVIWEHYDPDKQEKIWEEPDFLTNTLDAFIEDENQKAFRDTAQTFSDYFKGKDAIPIQFLEGAYDFVLTNQRLILPVPNDPECDLSPERWVIGQYIYRRTRTGDVGIPSGNGQRRRGFRSANKKRSSRPCTSIPVTEATIERWIESVPRIYREAVRYFLKNGLKLPDLPLNIHGYLLLERSCSDAEWYLEGAVLRKLVQELPKIITHIWYDREMAPNGNAKPGGYESRYRNDGLRSIFNERLEVNLPENVKYHIVRDIKDIEDIEINQDGFLVPDIPPVPSLDNMVQAWKYGDAFNPVFTDTMDTQ